MPTIIPKRMYAIDGKYKRYSPMEAQHPDDSRRGHWIMETDYYKELSVPETDILHEVRTSDDGRGQGGNGKPNATIQEAVESPSSVGNQPFKLLSNVKSRPVEWLWRNYIPKGELTIFDGDPGTNKSSLALDLAARVSTGREMPDGSPGIHGGVVLIQAEDSLTKTVTLRAQAAGADLCRIAVLQEEVTIPDDLTVIEKTVVAVKAKLIIIDPLMCFVVANANKEQAVRRALSPLRKLADRHNIAIAVIRHLNKSGGSKAIYRGGGSIGITATVRSEFLIAPSPEDENLRVLAHVKFNLGPKAPSLVFEPVGIDGGVRLEWRGQCDYTPADLLAKPKNARPALDTAVEVLLESLVDGPVEATEVQKRATAVGISLRTLERAKAEIDVKAYRKGNGRHRPWIWELPGLETEGD